MWILSIYCTIKAQLFNVQGNRDPVSIPADSEMDDLMLSNFTGVI